MNTHDDLKRINEIRGLLRYPASPNAYFQDFERSVAKEPVKRKHFVEIERELQGLDAEGWEYLKAKAAPLFEVRHPTRGSQAAFDILNQANAFNCLKKLGCSGVKFVPESAVRGRKTPDLQDTYCSTIVLCEVKTLNPSDEEAVARSGTIVRKIQWPHFGLLSFISTGAPLVLGRSAIDLAKQLTMTAYLRLK